MRLRRNLVRKFPIAPGEASCDPLLFMKNPLLCRCGGKLVAEQKNRLQCLNCLKTMSINATSRFRHGKLKVQREEDNYFAKEDEGI